MSSPTTRADGFDVAPAALRGAAGSFVNEADALAGAGVALDRHLSSLGVAPWGDDVVGARFGADYLPAASAVASNVLALAQGLARVSGALGAVADRYEQADMAAIPAESGSPGRASERGRSNDGSGRRSGDPDANRSRSRTSRTTVAGRRP